ncbi:MAG: hypothetical protein AAGI23_18910 [Bacteroidota bacterium]
MLDTKHHQSVINEKGETTSILVPYEDYQQMMEIIRQSNFLSELKADLHQSLEEIKEAKEGGKPLQALQSLLDESDY